MRQYKKSEDIWLGNIPVEWDSKKLKFSFKEVNEQRSETFENRNYIALENIESWSGKVFRGDEDPVFESTVKAFYPRDVLFNKLRPYLAKAFIANDKGVGVSELLVLRGISGEVIPKYLLYFLLSKPIIDVINSSTYGAKMPRASWNFIGNLNLPHPPLEEQQTIVRYLDEKLGQIDTFIHNKRRLIALLEEQKSALINQAVTKGLDEGVEMKDSGISWSSSIPTVWQVQPLKYLADVQTGVTLGKSFVGPTVEEFPYLRVANVQSGYFDLEDIKTIGLPKESASKYVLRRGDVLLTEGGDIDKLGRGHVWEAQIENCLHQNHIFAVRTNTIKLNPHFLAFLMASAYGNRYFIHTAKQTTNLASTNSANLKNFPVFLPPLSVQKKILHYLKQENEVINKAISNANQEIDLINEYRTTLISEVVTGKVDVRGAA